ncbi:hypothetical protein WT97_04005 [Burkholderia sp. MSMB1459WGS]|nr:hypothetical protein WT24_13320 [Burkholderia sp. MSMB1078WGS]KWO49022.1 hypothetical protein WT97_04005 [Burkholderia sp. MSMB1459WGS]
MSNRSYFRNVLPLRQKASIRPANVDPLVAFERQRAVDAPCDTPFGDHCGDVQPGIENAPTLRCGDTALFVPGNACGTHRQRIARTCAVVPSPPSSGKDDCCNMRNNCCRT